MVRPFKGVALGLSLFLISCGCASRNHQPHVSLAPEQANDGLQVSSATASGFDSTRVLAVFEHVATAPEFDNAYGLLILRHGQLVAEGYFRGYERSRRNNVKSVTKSVLSLLVGIAIDRGYIQGVDQKLSDFFPEYIGETSDHRMQQITLRDLLTMQAGLRWREHLPWFGLDWDPARMYWSSNTIAYVLGRPMQSVPGSTFEYSTGVTQLLAGVLWKATGQTPRDFAAEHLFEPLGIRNVEWRAGKDGISYGGVGLFLTPREMAKIGLLALQRGRWEGEQLVPEAWIDESTRGHAILGYSDGPYGYLWWVRPHGYTAQGARGQYVYVVPEEDLVVVLAARAESLRVIDLFTMDALVEQHVLPAIRR